MKLTSRGFGALLLLWIVSQTPALLAAENTLPWPTEASRRLTSTFAEPRTRHYHTGVDVSTNGRMGYDLYCPVDGWVLRASASYYGYGKQLLIQGNDGQRYLFAHMLDFSDTLEAVLEQHQLVAGSYNQELWFKPQEFALQRGEVVGRSGGSGAGPPHLHFEVRDGEGRAINPLRHGVAVADTRHPVIQQLAVLPVGEGSLVNGSTLPVVVDVQGEAPGYRLADTLHISGDARFSLRCFDRVDGSRSHLAPYELQLVAAEDTFYRAVFGRIAFRDTRWISAEINRWMVATREQTFRNLWYAGGGPTFCADAGSSAQECHGVMSQEGLCHATILVGDPVGNTSELSFVVLQEPASNHGLREGRILSKTQAHMKGPGLKATPLVYHNGEEFVFWQKLEQSTDSLYLEYDEPYLWPTQGLNNSRSLLFALPPIEDELSLWIGLPASGGARYLADYSMYALSPDAENVIQWQSGQRQASLRIEANSTPEEQVLLLARPDEQALLVGPANLCLTAYARLKMSLPEGLDEEDQARAAICRKREDDWEWCSGWALEDSLLACDLYYPGEYAVLVDRQPPRLQHQYPAASTTQGRPLFSWRCREDLSGVVHAELWLNERVVYPRYDGDTERILWKPRKPLDPGQYQLKLLVRDEAGNEASDQRSLTVQ